MGICNLGSISILVWFNCMLLGESKIGIFAQGPREGGGGGQG